MDNMVGADIYVTGRDLLCPMLNIRAAVRALLVVNLNYATQLSAVYLQWAA